MESYLEVRGRLEMLEKETPCMFSTISSLLLLVKKLCKSWEKLKSKQDPNARHEKSRLSEIEIGHSSYRLSWILLVVFPLSIENGWQWF